MSGGAISKQGIGSKENVVKPGASSSSSTSASKGAGGSDIGNSVTPFAFDTNMVVVVLPSDLSGMDVLWKVALSASDEAVASRAIKFLNTLHQNLDHDTDDDAGDGAGGADDGGSSGKKGGQFDSVREVRVQYITMCMKELEAGTKVSFIKIL
jgi:hypothetical protein